MAFDRRLGRAFNFDARDLESNRAGNLSHDQELMWRNTLRAYGRHSRRSGILVTIVFAAAAVAAGIGIAVTPGGNAAAGVIVAVVLGGLLLLVGLFRRRYQRTTDALSIASLQVSQGEFSWDSDLNARWWGHVGEARFAIDRLQEESLTTGATYRVFYLPAGDADWVMSIERLEGGGPRPE